MKKLTLRLLICFSCLLNFSCNKNEDIDKLYSNSFNINMSISGASLSEMKMVSNGISGTLVDHKPGGLSFSATYYQNQNDQFTFGITLPSNLPQGTYSWFTICKLLYDIDSTNSPGVSFSESIAGGDYKVWGLFGDPNQVSNFNITVTKNEYKSGINGSDMEFTFEGILPSVNNSADSILVKGSIIAQL